MSSQLGVKRRFIDGRNDWRYQTEKAPVNTSGSQFIQGEKLFYDPVTFYNDINCYGKYKGDGSLLTNVIGTDPTKLPLAGDTLVADFTLNTPNGNITLNPNNFTVSANDNITLNASNDAITITADDSISIASSGGGNIILDAFNINCFNWALPLCFNIFEQGSWSYTLGGQTLENVFTINILFPPQFFIETPQSGYTATRWQINFDMNCYNMANNADKAFATHMFFRDSALNIYSPFLYNDLAPFCKWDNPSTFNPVAGGPIKSINYCDYVDFGGMSGLGDSNVELLLYIAGDNPMNCDFKLKVGLTRINRV
jgi:hypothetical protein